MATKNEISEIAGKEIASASVNNSFVNGIVKVLKEKESLGLTFPNDYNYNNELLGAYLIMSETKGRDGKSIIESCTQASVVQTMMDMVTLGVSMQKKQCYPIAYGNKLQCQMSVYGNTCIARRYGLVRISGCIIYEGDEFAYHIEDGEIVIDKHTQSLLNIDPDKIIGAYAIAVMKDGYKHIELMNMPMIRKAWRQGSGYNEKGDGVHQKFPDQMAMKTVKNRALKFIIRTYCNGLEEEALSTMMDEKPTDEKIVADVECEIDNNANTVEFIDAEDIEVVEPTTPSSNGQTTIADFMQD